MNGAQLFVRSTRRMVLRRAPRLAQFLFGWDRADLGLASEAWVAHRLRRAGWRVLGSRVRLPAGELDLIAWTDGILVLMEVKSAWVSKELRQCSPGTWSKRYRPGHHFDRPQFERYRAALPQIRTRLGKASWHTERIDLVEVLWTRGFWSPLVWHYFRNHSQFRSD